MFLPYEEKYLISSQMQIIDIRNYKFKRCAAIKQLIAELDWEIPKKNFSM